MSEWYEVGQVQDIRRLGARVVETANGNIAIFRTADDEIFALVDECPHQGGPLSQGIIHGKAVACPLHNWNIDLNTGEVLGPDNGCSRVIPVEVEDGHIRIRLDTNIVKIHA